MNKTLTKIILGVSLLGLTSCGNIQYAPDYMGECQFNAEYNYKESKKSSNDKRMVAGYYKGHPHAWVEEWNDKRGYWEIIDPAFFDSKSTDYRTIHHYEWDSFYGEK